MEPVWSAVPVGWNLLLRNVALWELDGAALCLAVRGIGREEQLVQCASWEGQVWHEVSVREALHEDAEELVSR